MSKQILTTLTVAAWLLCHTAAAQNHFTDRDTIDVLHYNIQLDMGHHQPQHIQGHCDVTLRLLQPSNHVKLGLMSANIHSILVNGTTANNWNYDNREITVPITGATVNDTLCISVYYGSQGWVGTDGGFWCLENMFYNLGEDRRIRPFSTGRSWYPCSDSVYDRATYTFGITAAPGWTAICSGEHDSTVLHADSSRTFHYTLSHPASTYQIGINVAPYRVYNRTATGLYGTYPVRIATLSFDSAQVSAGFNTLDRTLQLYEHLFGPYRWGTIGFSEAGPGAGMEHINNISMTFNQYDIKYLIDHEFAHQWFGNLVTCAHLNDMWFNEGGATFADQMASLDGKPTAGDIQYFKSATLNQTPHNENGFHPLYGMPNQYAFMHSTYYKGALVFHELNHLLGDSLFFNMMQTLLQQNAFSNMNSHQLRDTMSHYSNTDLTNFFNFHIFNPGFASYSIDSMQTADGLTTLWLHQRLWHAPSYCTQANVPVTFFSTQGDTLTLRIASTGRYAHAQFQLPFTPAFAIVDYYNRTVCATITETLHLSNTNTTTSSKTNFLVTPSVLNDNVDLHATLVYGTADEEPTPGIVRYYNRRWILNGNYSTNLHAKTGFYFGNNGPIYDNEFYLGSATKDSLRLLYRKNPSRPWQIRKTATIQTYSTPYSRIDYMQYNGAPQGEYTLAVVDPTLLSTGSDDILPTSSTLPHLSLSPNPAHSQATVAFTATAAPGQCRLTLRNATGQQILTLVPQGYTSRIDTSTLPSGIYLLTLTTPTGTCTRKLLKQ